MTYCATKSNAIMFLFAAPTKITDVLESKKSWIFRPEYTFYYCSVKYDVWHRTFKLLSYKNKSFNHNCYNVTSYYI